MTNNNHKKEYPIGATWVFGYGSLIWRQDFPFIEARPAEINGWERRFWQGSHDHRGVPESPGRVVTLIPSEGAVCRGRAFLVEDKVFSHLDHREKNGYDRFDQDIHFDDKIEPGVVYIAPKGNKAYLGEASMIEIARQIRDSEGPSGHNAEYLMNLAVALRQLAARDSHVFELEQILKSL